MCLLEKISEIEKSYHLSGNKDIKILFFYLYLGNTVCKRCIEEKLVVENLKACPVCNVDLGVAPLDKLRLSNTMFLLMFMKYQIKLKYI